MDEQVEDNGTEQQLAPTESENKTLPEQSGVSADEEASKQPPAAQEDGKLETRLTIKDLEALQEAFNFKGDTFERLCLNKAQFIQALSIILNKGSEEEYAELFEKIDISKQDSVSWDQLAQHMLLQFYEKDDRIKSSQLPQWKDVRHIQAPHKDVIQRIDFLKSSQKYISVSREGSIAMLSSDLQLHRAMKAGSDACKSRDLWVTDFALAHTLNKIAVAFTSKEIAFYDISSKTDFSCQCRLVQLDASPLCLDFWHSEQNPNDAVLSWGDIKGNVNGIFFLSASINLFERQASNSAEENQETTLIVKLRDIRSGKFLNSNKFITHKAHTDWTRQVRYISSLDCFISCATTWSDSLVIGWIEKRTTMASQLVSVKRDDDIEVISFKKPSVFLIHQGVNDFDFHHGLNLIATAGANNHVCLWNPYVVSKPNGVLTGHVAPVLQVIFNCSKGQVLSFSKDKVLRIWDVQLQVCVQRLAGIFPKGPEVTTRMYLQEDRGRLFMSFNYSLNLLEMRAEVKDKILSHDRPVTAVIFNVQLNQVLTACQAGTLTFWLLDSGQRLRSTPQAHGTAEITVLVNDPAEPRFYSGGTDGFVRVWDWNGHMYHELDCNIDGVSAEVSQILVLKHGIIATGFSKEITVFRTTAFRDVRVTPGEWKETEQHKDEILAAAFSPPQQLITASYDGAICVWNVSSEVCTRKMLQRATAAGDASSRSSVASASSRASSARRKQAGESNYTISRLCVLNSRRAAAKVPSCANLISCGANGVVRFWNFHHGSLIAEFVAHQQVSNIIMKVTPDSSTLVTADGNGALKVWSIADYCCATSAAAADDDGHDAGCDVIHKQPPPLTSEWQAHNDQINSLEFAMRQDRQLVITVSSDCSAIVWDLMGNLVGTFGQPEHWKIEHLSVILERAEQDNQQQAEAASSAADEKSSRLASDDCWQPDDRAVTTPADYRLNAWETSLLGSKYQEFGSKRRQRKQPNVIPNLAFLAHDRHTPTLGPFSDLQISNFGETREVRQPEFVRNPDAYFRDKDNVIPGADKMPVLAETLKAAFDDRSLFPKYILDYETQMKKYQNYALATSKEKESLKLTAPSLASASPSDQQQLQQSRRK